ncbi:MAG TPA: carboxypeptidase-like regulatory domain-containing protein, partial [Pyrinomonadaceae bacterium]
MLYHRGVRAKIFSTLLLLVSFASLVRAAGAQEASPAPAKGGLRGAVVDRNGEPVAGASVALTIYKASVVLNVQRQVTTGGAVTDAEGRFEFDDPESFGFMLTVTAGGFAPFGREWKPGEWRGGELRVVLEPAPVAERV